jgi:hypothetical protein
MRQLHSQSSPFCLNGSGVLADYTWDSLGRLTSFKYPSYHVNNGGTYTPVTGPTYAYQYDAMSRPYSMTENGVTLATGAQYGPAHELTSSSTRAGPKPASTTPFSISPASPSPAPSISNTATSALRNTGRITQFKDWVTGEEVTYAYDALNRLQPLHPQRLPGADKRLEEFLLTVGRRKFLKPLYEELAKTPEGRKRAAAIYAKARPLYHPICVNTVDQILR